MSYKNRAKTRKLKKQLVWLFEIIKFKWINLSLAWKIILFWNIISIISLFSPWINSTNINIKENAFSNLTWKSGYIILILVLVNIFTILSVRKKEKLKSILNLYFKDNLLFLLTWLIIILLSYIALNFTNWLDVLSSQIFYGKWIILSFIWWITITIWWILYKKEEEKNNRTIFLNDNIDDNPDKLNNESKNNMKLPF